jgi:hypothetical protein
MINNKHIKKEMEMTNPEHTKKQKAHAKWKKAIKMAQRYEDSIIFCEDESDMAYLEKEEKAWNAKAKEYRAEYLRSV